MPHVSAEGQAVTPEERQALAERVAEVNRLDSAMGQALIPEDSNDEKKPRKKR